MNIKKRVEQELKAAEEVRDGLRDGDPATDWWIGREVALSAVLKWIEESSPWTPVSERLPEKEDLYFTKGVDGDFDVDWFDLLDEAIIVYWKKYRSKWMEIPE